MPVEELRVGGQKIDPNGSGPGGPVSWDDLTDLPDTFPPTPHSASHASGGADALTLAQSQISGLSAALAGKVAEGDSRLSDARAPTPHSASHGVGQVDAVTVAQSQVTGLSAALSAKLEAAALSPYQQTAQKGQANGYAGLGADGKVPAAQLPPGGAATVREDLAAQWDLSSPKTNIGSAFVDLYTQAGSDGKSAQIDTTGKTQVRLMVLWSKVGTGVQTVQVLEVGTANVLVSLDVVTGRNVSALVSIPVAMQGRTAFVKLQGKSTVAADDPSLEGARVYLR